MSAAFSYIFTWHALSDACPKCQSLNGKEYQDQDIYQNVLWDVFYGDIWDLNADHTLAHPNCRCQVEVRVVVDWSKVRSFEDFASSVRQTLEDHSVWR